MGRELHEIGPAGQGEGLGELGWAFWTYIDTKSYGV